MRKYEPFGPFDIDYEALQDGKRPQHFWKGPASALAPRRGIYVFGIRAGQGMTPWYVGQATKSFKQEIFQDGKLLKYLAALNKYRRGTPIMFFIARHGRGAIKASQAREIERFLIHTGWKRNPGIRNINDVGIPDWGIKGVLRGGIGKPSRSARAFRRLMGV